MKTTVRSLLPLALPCVLLGCSEDAPQTEDPVIEGTWVEVATGGETSCSRGTPYSFFVNGGDADKLVIDFRGGGACWNDFTCAVADQTFSAEVDDFASWSKALDTNEGGFGGIYDTDRKDYPFAGFTVVHIPYCTGDIHWGDNTVEYNTGAINHRGFVNASAVLDWVYERYPNPSQILVTGCSAGAYGAILHSAFIAEHYPNARVATLSDSGAGIITDTFFEDSFPNWNALENLPPNVPRLTKDPAELTSADVYAGVPNAYPNQRFAHYSSNYDADQTFFFTAMGGEASEWPGLMRARMEEVRADADNFRYYIAPGPMHCITPYDFMYQRSGETPFIAWLDQLVFGDDLPSDVACEGAECDTSPLCDACAAMQASSEEADRYCRFCDGWPEDYITPPSGP